MAPRGEDLTALAGALRAVDRRLALRARVVRATGVGAAVAVPAALWMPGAIGAIALGSAAVVAAATARPTTERAALWLDRRGAQDELMISGEAVARGGLATRLSEQVMIGAGRRAATVGRPSYGPALAGLALVVGLVGWVASRAPAPAADAAVASEPASLASATAGRIASPRGDGAEPGARPTPAAVAVDDRAMILSTTVATAGLAGGAGAGASGEASSGGGSAKVALHDGGVGGTGSGEGSRAGARSTSRAATTRAAAARAALTTSAPRAGAGAALGAVPSRYRGLVAAYLGGGR